MADLKTTVTDRWESTLSSALASGATTINVADTTDAPAVPFRVVIDPGNDAKYEEVLVDAGKTATTFTLTSATSRGQGISSDIAHDSGAVIAIVPVANHINDLHDRVDANNTLITSGEAPGHTHNAAYVGVGDITVVRKTADESVASSTTLQNDDHLTFPIGANETWVVKYVLFLTGSDAGDFKSVLGAPSGATGWRGGIGPALAATSAEDAASRFIVLGDLGTGTLVFGTTTNGTVTAVIRAVVINGSTAGSVTLRWAQNTSDATATRVRQNSHLVAHKL